MWYNAPLITTTKKSWTVLGTSTILQTVDSGFSEWKETNFDLHVNSPVLFVWCLESEEVLKPEIGYYLSPSFGGSKFMGS